MQSQISANLKEGYDEYDALWNSPQSVVRATLNILEDLSAEKPQLKALQKAAFNILEDFNAERISLVSSQKAAFNILEDFSNEKQRLQETQKATINLLEDFQSERIKVETINQSLHREIQEHHKARESVIMLNEELKSHTADLEALNHELEAFSYSVSHDLRAPLRHIAGFIELLKKNLKGKLDDQGSHYLEVISDSASQMARLIDDLLAFSRMGRSEMMRSAIDLNDLVKGTLATFKDEINERDIVWNIQTLSDIRGDRAMLQIVFTNLISNALKYTRSRNQVRIEIGSVSKPNETVVFVRDNGVGFDMRYLNKLFSLFQRLHRAEDFEGTGVGLANVRRIIQRHGGKTWAEGVLGEGATFYFSIPNSIPAEE